MRIESKRSGEVAVGMENHESWRIPNSTKLSSFLSFSGPGSKELAKRVGKGREDFVIPLKSDDLASDETTIELTRLNSIDFRGGWVEVSRSSWRSWRKTGCPSTRASMRLRWRPGGRTTCILGRRSSPAASRRPAMGFRSVSGVPVCAW